MGIRMILMLTKVNPPMSWTINVLLDISNLLGFDPNAMLHTSVQLRKVIYSMLDSILWEVPPPSSFRETVV